MSFSSNPEAQLAFRTLKIANTSSPILQMTDFTKPFVLDCDASRSRVGVVLMQDGQPLAFFNKALSSKSLVVSSYERELMALVMVVSIDLPLSISLVFVTRPPTLLILLVLSYPTWLDWNSIASDISQDDSSLANHFRLTG